MIAIQNIIDSDKSLLTIIFDRKVLKHIKCKCDDYILLLQSNFNPYNFFLVKCEDGYRIRRYPNYKKIYQVNISYRYKDIPEFELTECTYFLKKNNSIRILLKA